MKKLPRAHKTFFFSDIEGSTQHARRLGGAYAALLEKYHQTIRRALERYGGEEIDTAGDGFFATFDRPAAAMNTAANVQRAFQNREWATREKLRVRIGIHTGEAIATKEGFTGLEVHRAARVCSAAYGGQVLISSAARKDLSIDELRPGLMIRKLGEYILKDFDSSEALYQLLIPGTQHKFPPPRTSLRIHTVAVLPFDNLSGDPSQDYFCDGMAEEITIALGKLPDLQVVARSSAFALKGEQVDAREAGQRLHATSILEGAVRKQNGHLRITVELINAETGYSMWSGRFDRRLEDVFTIQDEIAEQVARALHVKVVPNREGAIQSMQTDNITAYDFYLRGRRFYYQFSRQGVEFALQMFQKAIGEDSAYALAYCGLADCYSYLYMYVRSDLENLQAASDASRRAIELDPMLAEAYASRGLALSLDGNYRESAAHFERAIELDPRLFEAWYQYARTTFVQGKLSKAAHLFETANQVQPEDYPSILLAGQIYHDLGLEEPSKNARRRGVEIAEHQLQLNPGDTRALYMGANGLVALGETEKGLEWLRRALSLEPNDAMLLYNAGCIYALAGMTDPSLDCLERSVSNGLTQRGWFENDSNLDSVREHPRFRELLERMPE